MLPAVLAALLTVLAAVALPVAPVLDAQPGATVVEHVHVVDFDFSPATIEIAPGDSVEWDNHDSAPHTVTAEDGSFDSGRMNEGDSFTHAFASAGTFAYRCDFHSDMRGTVVVKAPNAAPTVRITSPADGATVRGAVTVTGTAADSDGSVTLVEVAVDDGAFESATGTTSWTFQLDTTDLENGAHAIRARAFDGDDHSAVATVNVVVDNPRVPDLVAGALVARSTGFTSRSLSLVVTNDGNAAAGAFDVTFYYAYRGGLRPVGSASVSGLAAGESAEVTVPWDATGKVGRFGVVALVDEANRVSEKREDNNRATASTVFLVDVEGVDVREP